MILNELNTAKNKLYKRMLLQAVAMCFWNSLDKTIAFLEASKLTEGIFKLMFNEIDEFNQDYEIRRMLFGLTTLIEGYNLLPPVLVLVIYS